MDPGAGAAETPQLPPAALEAVLADHPRALDDAIIAVRAGAVPDTGGREDLAHAWRRAQALAAQLDALVLLDENRHEEALVALRAAALQLVSVLARMPPLDPQRPIVARALVDAGIATALVPGADQFQRSWASLQEVAVLANVAGLRPSDRAEVLLFVLQRLGPGPGGLATSITLLEEVIRVQAEAGRADEEAFARLSLAGLRLWLGDDARGMAELDVVREELRAAAARDPDPPPLSPDGQRAVEDVWAGVPGVLRRMAEAELDDDVEAALERHLEWRGLRRAEALARMYAGQALVAAGDASRGLEVLEGIDPVDAGLPATAADELKVHRAAALLGAGSPGPALELLGEAQRALGDPQRPALALLRARALAAVGSEDAAAVLDGAVETAAAAADLDTLWQALAERARRAPDGGLADWLAAAEAIAALRRVPLGYRLDSALLRRRMPVLRAAIAAAAGPRGDAAATCRLVETAKARALAVVLSLPPRASGPASPQDANLDGLSAEADRLEYKAYAAGGWTPELRAESEGIRRQRADELERMRLVDARARALSEPPAFDLEAVRASLSEARQSALSLFFDQDRDVVVTVLVDRDGVAVAEQPAGSTTRARLDRYCDTLVARRPQATLFDPSAALGLTVDDFVPAELLRRAASAGSLVVAPHGRLHLLPWPSLRFEGRRLLERLPVGMLPGLAALPPLSIRPLEPVPRVALYGDPAGAQRPPFPDLPALGPELDELADLHGGGLLTAPQRSEHATQAGLIVLATRADAEGALLHIGCHGTFDQEDPQGSGLLLAGGKLDAAEIARLRVRYGEIVLSACSTGWRPMRAAGMELLGDDALGLVAAFLEAGAASVLACIPPAFDTETRDLMVAFHRHRLAGTPPMAALRDAQLERIAAGTDAYKVTGFVVYGAR